MRIKTEECCLLLIDIQEKLIPLISNKDSPAHEYKKIDNKRYFIDFINIYLKINPFNLNVND